jgi:hypothetical protein
MSQHRTRHAELCAWLLVLAAAGAHAATCRMEPSSTHAACGALKKANKAETRVCIVDAAVTRRPSTLPYAGLPYDLSNFQASHSCSAAVKIGRPRNWAQLAELVKSFDRVKAVGMGHSWWAEQFCAGGDARSINIVMTELTATLAT